MMRDSRGWTWFADITSISSTINSAMRLIRDISDTGNFGMLAISIKVVIWLAGETVLQTPCIAVDAIITLDWNDADFCSVVSR
jgi:hypothetical protein